MRQPGCFGKYPEGSLIVNIKLPLDPSVGNYPKPKAEDSQLCAGIALWDTTPPPNDTRSRLRSQRLRVYLAGTALWLFKFVSQILRSIWWPGSLSASSPFCFGGPMLTGVSKGDGENVSGGVKTGSCLPVFND